MKLEKDMYVRTKFKDEVVIRKIVNFDKDPLIKENRLIFDKPTKYLYYEQDNNYIAKKNIIDLIEVGDYVNGFPVEDYFHKYNKEKDIFENVGVVTTECYLEDINFSWILEKDIKTIVTKEQFEKYSYKIGE